MTLSENLDQPVVAEAPVAAVPAGVEAAAPAVAATDDDIETDAFDRVEVPDDEAEPATSEDGQPIVTMPTDDEFEFEADDGTKLKLPKAVEAALLRQADYTKKTQAVADKARALDVQASELATRAVEQAESLNTLRTEHIALHQAEASLADIETELAGYRKYTAADWEATKTANRANYDAHMERYKDLQGMKTITSDAVEAAKADLTAKEASLTEKRSAAEEATLNANWGKANAVLTEKIEGWGPDKFKEIGTFANKEFGITADQLRASVDPVAWQMANRLMKAEAELAVLRKTTTQAKATATALKPQAVTPAAKPAGGNAKPTGISDQLSDAEWLRRRNAQVAKKRA